MHNAWPLDFDLRHHWQLAPDVLFLNHGSFGACPRTVLAQQAELRARLERQPLQFMLRDLPSLVDAARAAVAAFVHARPEDVVFVSNATSGVNTVLRSLEFAAGDELLVTNHAYQACRNAADYALGRGGGRVVCATVPFPIGSPDQVVEAVMAAVTPRTRLALLDHVTSATGLVFPIERLVRELSARGIDTLVDGAHAPGMVEVDLQALGAAYYTANCHKWMCAPKGAAFLVVRADRQAGVRPLTISHGASSTRRDRSRFLVEFDWQGTDDPTPQLCVPEAIRAVGSFLGGGWPAVRAHNRAMALAARRHLCAALRVEAPAPDSMIGSLASIPLPDAKPAAPGPGLFADALHDRLIDEFHIEVPVMTWPAPAKRLFRIAAQLYNRRSEYERLASVLPSLV